MRNVALSLVFWSQVWAAEVGAQCATQIVEPSVRTMTDGFGGRMAVSGDTMVVSARGSDAEAGASGLAFVFERQGAGWAEAAVLRPPFPTPNLRFGEQVAIDGDTIMVSAVRELPALPGSSAVYVYERTGGTWMRTQRLFEPSSSGGQDGFGIDIEIDGDRAFLSKFGDGLYVYDRVGASWSLTEIITEAALAPFTLPPNGDFPHQIAVDGDRIVATLTWHFTPVYVLEHDGTDWGAVADLGMSHLAAIDVERSSIFVGHGSNATVTVFRETGGAWSESQVLVASVPACGFGLNFDADEDLLAVGAQLDNREEYAAGSVFVYEERGDEWVQVQNTPAPNPLHAGQFGEAVALAHGQLIAGQGRVYPNMPAGEVAVFPVRAALGQPYGATAPNSSGVAADLHAFGSPRIGLGCVELEVTELPLHEFGYFLMSVHQAHFPGFGGSAGTLLLDTPIVRFNGDLLHTGDGSVTFTPDLGALPLGLQVQPGETWNFQMWFRDQLTSNTSNAVALTFETNGDPAVQFPVTLMDVEEEATQVSVLVTLSQRAEHDVVVPFTTGGTASYGVDWRVGETNPFVVPAGELSREMRLVIAEDGDVEGDETAIVVLGVAAAQEMTLTIVDDD
ncbi:MAG: hypothetical protein GY711_07140 [bacterium]|nr:hypothetical protein [bacterium]